MGVSHGQAESRRPVVVNGSVRTHGPTTVKALAGFGHAFPNTVTLLYNGCTLNFEAGLAYQLDPPLLAYLTANGITPTAL